jgi:hypothetical protein
VDWHKAMRIRDVDWHKRTSLASPTCDSPTFTSRTFASTTFGPSFALSAAPPSFRTFCFCLRRLRLLRSLRLLRLRSLRLLCSCELLRRLRTRYTSSYSPPPYSRDLRRSSLFSSSLGCEDPTDI